MSIENPLNNPALWRCTSFKLNAFKSFKIDVWFLAFLPPIPFLAVFWQYWAFLLIMFVLFIYLGRKGYDIKMLIHAVELKVAGGKAYGNSIRNTPRNLF